MGGTAACTTTGPGGCNTFGRYPHLVNRHLLHADETHQLCILCQYAWISRVLEWQFSDICLASPMIPTRSRKPGLEAGYLAEPMPQQRLTTGPRVGSQTAGRRRSPRVCNARHHSLVQSSYVPAAAPLCDPEFSGSCWRGGCAACISPGVSPLPPHSHPYSYFPPQGDLECGGATHWGDGIHSAPLPQQLKSDPVQSQNPREKYSLRLMAGPLRGNRDIC